MKSTITAATLFLFATLSQASVADIPWTGEVIDLGAFQAGSYRLAGSGSIALCPGGAFLVGPDGVSLTGYPVVCPGGNGIYTEPSSTLGYYPGPAGTNVNIGALVATLNPNAYTGLNPTESQASDWFLVGYGVDIILSAPSHIYAALNDNYPSNNSGAFQISVEAAGTAVPEPATAALALGGLLGMAGVQRRRRGAPSRG